MINANTFTGELSIRDDVDEAARQLAHKALAVNNHLVHALWGDGANPEFKTVVRAVKGSEASKPFGLTLPNEQFLEYVEPRRLHPDIRTLFNSSRPQLLTRLTGGLVFWRLPGREEVKNSLPDTVWSVDSNGLPIVQNWSPEGKNDIAFMLGKARQLGVEFPAVTSLNKTKEPEITEADEARVFSKRHTLALLRDNRVEQLTQDERLFVGSFPVIMGNETGLCVLRGRSKSIGTLILSRLLDGYPLEKLSSRDVQPGRDPAELRELSGQELRAALLQKLGWTAFQSLS